MSEPQRETVSESPTPSLTGTVLGDQCQRIVDEEKDLFGKEVEGYESAVAADEIEDRLDVHPDGGLRAWLVCMGVNDFDPMTAVFLICAITVLSRRLLNVWSRQRMGCKCPFMSRAVIQ